MRGVHVAVLSVPKGHVGNARLAVGNADRRVPSAGRKVRRRVLHVAALRRVQGRFRHFLVVHSLDDVYFAVQRPVFFVRQPHGRPGPASGGHVVQIYYEKSAVEFGFSFEPNGIAGTGVGRGRSHVNELGLVDVFRAFRRVGHVGQIRFFRHPQNTRIHGTFLGNIINVSVRTYVVGTVVKVIIVEHFFPFLSLYQPIGTLRHFFRLERGALLRVPHRNCQSCATYQSHPEQNSHQKRYDVHGPFIGVNQRSFGGGRGRTLILVDRAVGGVVRVQKEFGRVIVILRIRLKEGIVWWVGGFHGACAIPIEKRGKMRI
mmetsp:Transcript_12501/g.27611  ORF Transcript_12501/g.27611 Transcript_12501/m.27611 type:complete len:316 (-) Transcript_12501:66-1013(-)